MGHVLFTVIITPIIQILEFFYQLFFEVTLNPGISVIGLSLVVTLCTLPLYMVAEKWQETERNLQIRMQGGISRIKKYFKGDEQYMILTTFYRQNHYHPLMALRSSFSLLIQIPFFISAYQFLSHLDALKGVSFLFIRDFGSPDSTFVIGGFAVNVLPIAMTIINCMSGVIYSKGHGIKEKVQIFACALVFLVLLYNSPSGLVVYWTMNNIFSLTKNIFYKMKNPRKVLFYTVWILAILSIPLTFFVVPGMKTVFKAASLIFALAVPMSRRMAGLWNRLLGFIFDGREKIDARPFLASVTVLALLAGLGIPSILMESEPEQYCFVERVVSPFVFLRHTFYQGFGLFIFWPVCFYNLFSVKAKKSLTVIFSVMAVLALVNTFVFSENYGPIMPELIFMTPQKFEPTNFMVAVNALAMAAAAAGVVILLKKKPGIFTSLVLLVSFSLAVTVGRNAVSINNEFKKMKAPEIKTDIEKSYHLSKNGRNVILIMQDRLVNYFTQEIFKDYPEIKDRFDGFTLYPNIVSMGKFTMLGTPGLFGGYDYSPWEIMQRKDESLQKKHNEALLTLPRLFHNAGFDVTVSGLPYENYLEYPITDMYAEDRYVVRAETRGLYSDHWYIENDFPKAEYLEHDIKRNFIWFSIFKMVSPVLRRTVYHNGYWTSFDRYNDGIARFIDNYSELEYLPEMIDAESDRDSFIMIDNELVHESIDLPLPDFDPVRLRERNNEFNPNLDRHYTTMVATFNKLGDFIQRLKDLGVYDNTRIVIVSDHGKGGIEGPLENTLYPFNKQNFNCTLLVKDFASHGSVVEDNSFMTNCDTPYICTEKILAEEDAVNPFTKNPLKVEDKNSYVKLFNAQAESTRIRKESQWHIKDTEWYTVHDDIYKNENWSQLNK